MTRRQPGEGGERSAYLLSVEVAKHARSGFVLHLGDFIEEGHSHGAPGRHGGMDM